MDKHTAQVDMGKSLFSGAAGGRWATEQLLKAAKEGKPLTADALRTLDTLRHEEWKTFDEAIVEDGQIQLKGVADLIEAGLVIPVSNSLGKTVFAYETMTDMDDATVSLDGRTRSPNDTQEVDLSQVPLPITHKDFDLNLRVLMASREKGEALDTTMARTAGRKVSEMQERMLFLGRTGTFGGLSIYGYTTHPNRNTLGHGTNGTWDAAAKTGADILADTLAMMNMAAGDRFFGPYWLYVARSAGTKLEDDFKANGSLTIRQRLEGIEGIKGVRVVDQLTTDNVVLVQATRDVVAYLSGEPLQTIQWDLEGGFSIKFKAFQIAVPLIRADSSGRSGVVHMSS